MNKSIIKANIVIMVMLIVLTGVSFSNFNAQSVKADSRVIYFGDKERNNVCFMFNVYQNSDEVRDILDILDVYNAKTTFFIGGCWAVNNIDLVKEIYTRGHEIGNHGFYHKDMDKLDYGANHQEIDMCHQVVKKNLGIDMNMFAPPSGAYCTATVDVAETLGYKTIMWTRDTIDWRDQDADLIYKRAVKDMTNGDLVLMHPTKKTVEALTQILATAINNGFNPTTVSNCL